MAKLPPKKKYPPGQAPWDDHVKWTADELAEPHTCPACGYDMLFAQDFCDASCRRVFKKGAGKYLDLAATKENPAFDDLPALQYVRTKRPGVLSSARTEAQVLSALEGEESERLVKRRVRERGLRVAKLAAAKAKNNGRLVCEVPGCGFDFAERYGALGDGYAQVHHLKPLADRVAPTMTNLKSLAVVCANCHAMIHVGGKTRSLRTLIPREKRPATRLRPGR